MTHETSFKFTLLNQSILKSLWAIWHNSSLENPILIRLAGLERLLRGSLQEEISYLGDPKLQRYIGFKIELLQSEKRCVVLLIFLHKLGLKN